MPPPDQRPGARPPAEVASTGSYRDGAPVWVHRAGAWRPGRVVTASTSAATVRYRPTDARGTAVDTVTAAFLAARYDPDLLLDGATPLDHPSRAGD